MVLCVSVCVCVCVSYVVFLYVYCINLHHQQIQADQKDTQRLCMRNVSRVQESLCVFVCECVSEGIKHTCSEDLLSTTRIPPLHNTGAVYRHKHNRKKPAGILQVFPPLLLPTVALACSKAACDGGRIGL